MARSSQKLDRDSLYYNSDLHLMHKQNLLRTLAWRVNKSNAGSQGMAHLEVCVLGRSLTGCNGWSAMGQGDLTQCGRIFMNLHGYIYTSNGSCNYLCSYSGLL